MLLAQENEDDLSLPISSHPKHLFFGKSLTTLKLLIEKTVIYSVRVTHLKTPDICVINLMKLAVYMGFHRIPLEPCGNNTLKLPLSMKQK